MERIPTYSRFVKIPSRWAVLKTNLCLPIPPHCSTYNTISASHYLLFNQKSLLDGLTLGPMVLKPEQASESPGGPVKTDRRPHPYSFWFSGPWVGPENWPNRFPGSADSADSGALGNTALDLSLLTQHQRQTLQQALALTPSTPLAHNGTVLVYSVSTTPWWLGQPCHKANPRGPTTPWSREWFKVTMDTFLTHEKGFCNLPLHVQVRGRKASKPAVLLQPWGELGSTQQQNRQVGRTWRLVLTLTCWVNRPRTTSLLASCEVT